MFRKSYLLFTFAVAMLAFGSVAVFGQYAPTSGKIEMAETHEPVVGARIDVYRTDIKAGAPGTDSKKRGEFQFAGLALGGTYVFSVSAPNCAPVIFPNVKAGQEKLLIQMTPGDGKKWTEAEVREALTKGVPTSTGGETQSTGSSEEQKKADAEYAAKVKESNEKAAKTKSTNETVAKANEEAVAASNAKNYDLAIAKAEEGIAAAPTFVGSAPPLLIFKALNLQRRATDRYNANIPLTDATAKLASNETVKKDFVDSVNAFKQALDIIKNAPPADITDPARNENNRLQAIRGLRETFKYAVLTDKVDPSIIDTAKVMLPEYIAIEPDAVKKTETALILADLYRINGNSDEAVAAYKKVLETSPDNQEALVQAGLVLVDAGWLSGDKAKSQEGANFLQKFVSIAPDTHKMKEGAVGYLKILKDQSVIPEKLPTTKRKN